MVGPGVERLLANLERSDVGRVRGSFDRDYWAWKFRDYPPMMLQTASHALALAWRSEMADNPWHRNERLAAWVAGALEWTLDRQHRNGAFDQVVPNDQDVGATLGIAHSLGEVYRILEEPLDTELRTRILESVHRACRFSRGRQESHGFVSNHVAMFGLAFQVAGEILDDATWTECGAEQIGYVLARQSAEGWYEEYGGADPGYETLGIRYLADYWARTGNAEVLGSLERSLDFLSRLIHPDGSLGGPHGSRHVSLYYPSGFEQLSGHLAVASRIARFMADRLDRRNVVVPSVCDPENLPSLCASYLEACRVEGTPNDEPADMPCHRLEGLRVFEDAGIGVVGTERLYAVVGCAKGGVCRVHDRLTERLLYEDAGYVIERGADLWSSQLSGMGSLSEGGSDEAGSITIACSTRFARVRQDLPTPFAFLVLRILNLTLWRSLLMGSLFRRAIARRLITGRREAPVTLNRVLTFEPDGFRLLDRLEPDTRLRVSKLRLARRFKAMHMGSAHYYHPSELTATPGLPAAEAERMLASLREGRPAVWELEVR